ncbi:unnamed protein product [Clonostachys rosea f. rosea IK726]|uniref:Uncharacterized protein n=1 Tax=Clonostachys rosea f. rosea IK726 TaxID=1349383 RepID=A0ACA9TUS7_BIOOC|nr:unnamed protein product [Clonostachys rosea f. rosea IK726]
MMRATLGLALFWTSHVAALGYANRQKTPLKDDEKVAALFPAPEGDLISPAFLFPHTVPEGFANNSAPPTDSVTSASFLKLLAQRNPWINYHEPDFTSEEGRLIPYVYLSKTRKDYTEGSSDNKLRIWIQGGTHGDEPAGPQSVLALIGKLNDDKKWASSVLDKADLLVLPLYNPDGTQYFQRELVTGFDGNRDHALLQRKQTRDVKQLLNRFNPHISHDAHEYTAWNRFGGNYIKSHDLQFSAVKNPNIRPEIRSLGERLFTDTVYSTVRKAGYRTGPYFTGTTSGNAITLTEPGSSSSGGHNSWGLGQRLSFLAETRGIRLGDQHFKRRVATGLLAAETVLRVATENKDLIYNIIEDARREFINGNDEIVVMDKSRVTKIDIDLIDVTTGEVVDVPVTFNNNTPSDVVLTRPRPEAYIFSGAWSDIAERLRVLGLKVDVLESDFYGTVETLVATNVSLATSRNQGIVQATVSTKPSTRIVRIPAGAFRVSTRQQNAAYAFVTLEPENVSSFVTTNTIPLDVGEEYPVFRIV